MPFKSGTQVWTWDRCYGRDGNPTPTELNERVMAQFALNVELQLDGLPRRRAGSVATPFGGVSFTNFVKLGRFFGRYELGGPIDEYLFWTDQAGRQVWARFQGLASASLAVPNPADVFLTSGIDTAYCQFNGKMYKAASSNVDRLHVMDPNDPDSPTGIRRVGIGRPVAPGVTNSGSGAYTGLRYYRIQYKVKNALGITRRQSVLGDPIGITPSGTGTALSVAPASSAENPTHFVVWGSSDNALYYNLSGDILMTTGFFLDSNAVTTYANFPPAPEEGAYNTWPSVKFLLSGIDRLIGFGAFFGADAKAGNVSTPGRVWFSPVLGTSNTEDDERVPVQLAGSNPIQNWIDVGRGTGQVDTGLGGPIDGNVLVFQSRGVYLLVPTGNVYAPFKRVTISTDVGAIECSIFTGQDELGRPCVYWLDETAGAFRYGARGLEWLSYDIRDEWRSFNRTAPEFQRAHGVFHNETQTAFFWISQGTTPGVGTPNRILSFNARLGKDTGPTGIRFGWSIGTGAGATALGSVIARRSISGIGAATDSMFQPIVSGATGAKLLVRDPLQITDDGTAFVASVRSKVIDFSGASFQVRQLITDWLYVQAVRASTSLQVSLIRNYGDQVAAAAVRPLNPPLQAAETRVLIRYEGLLVQDAYALQLDIADPIAPLAAARWDVDYVVLPIEIRTQERWNVSA